MVASSGPTVAFNAWMPVDDDHTVQISFTTSLREPVSPEGRAPSDPYTRLGGYLPSTSEALTRWRSPANAGNDYMIDYEIQRTFRFSGIPREGKLQDMAVMETMGYIYDRTKEHLGRLGHDDHRRAPRSARGRECPGRRASTMPTVDNPRLYRVRPVEILLPEGDDWFEATEQHRASDARVRLENFVTAGLV